ncbi:MAG: hypothetical protein IT433_09810 [Phycisphaerales bacterium]|nr:hypothetical protein [Phycisphaerales bacterium]
MTTNQSIVFSNAAIARFLACVAVVAAMPVVWAAHRAATLGEARPLPATTVVATTAQIPATRSQPIDADRLEVVRLRLAALACEPESPRASTARAMLSRELSALEHQSRGGDQPAEGLTVAGGSLSASR